MALNVSQKPTINTFKGGFIKTLGLMILLGILLLAGCSNRNAKIPLKNPCACYDIIIDMSKRG